MAADKIDSLKKLLKALSVTLLFKCKRLKMNCFSLIELLSVIVVILILITLAMPGISRIRQKARTVVCANQLKQLGTLLSIYSNDNNGYLPYSRNAPTYGWGTHSYKDRRLGPLYGLWSGHLIPYLNADIPSWSRGMFYHDKARSMWVPKLGRSVVKYLNDKGDIEKWPSVNVNENSGNWKLLHDMYYEGGYGSLKVFICPEAASTYNAHVPNRLIPRISGILPPGLMGLPSSYLGNGQLFGSGTNSKRLEDINRSNFLLLEGCDQFNQEVKGLMTPPNFSKFFSAKCAYGGGVNNIVFGWSPRTQNPGSSPRPISASFFHDDTKEVWSSWEARMSLSNVNRYNNSYAPNSIASFVWDRPEYSRSVLISNKYPGKKWGNFETSSTKGRFSIYRYYSEDRSPSSMFGQMNLLTADLSVKNAHMGWLYENGRVLGQNTE